MDRVIERRKERRVNRSGPPNVVPSRGEITQHLHNWGLLHWWPPEWVRGNVVRGNRGFQIRWRCHGTGGSLHSRGYYVKINIQGEMNMPLCLYNLLSLVSVLQGQVLFLKRYALLLRRRRALYSVCLNDGGKRAKKTVWTLHCTVILGKTWQNS